MCGCSLIIIISRLKEVENVSGVQPEFTIPHSCALKTHKWFTMATSVCVIDCSHWNLRWKCTPRQGQTTQWVMSDWECSMQYLTTVFIQGRLTKDILLDEIGEMGKNMDRLSPCLSSKSQNCLLRP